MNFGIGTVRGERIQFKKNAKKAASTSKLSVISKESTFVLRARFDGKPNNYSATVLSGNVLKGAKPLEMSLGYLQS